MNQRFDKTKTVKKNADQTQENDALDRALRQIGEEILDEPVPDTLRDPLSRKKTPPEDSGENDDEERQHHPPSSAEE